MSQNNYPQYDQELCPDGICHKRVKNHQRAGMYKADGQGICGGKIIRVLVRYGPLSGFGEFSTYEELCCTRCRWKKRLKLVGKKYIKPKNEVWIKKNKNNKERKEKKRRKVRKGENNERK